jgi:phage terminase large subunit-like protein
LRIIPARAPFSHGESGILEAAEAVRFLAETYAIAEITYDPWRAAQLGQELAERGITASNYPQTDQRAIPASARLRDAIVRQRLVLPDDPVLRQHAANAIARSKPRGWRIDAPDRSSNVDAMIALMMALDRFENQPRAARLIGWL